MLDKCVSPSLKHMYEWVNCEPARLMYLQRLLRTSLLQPLASITQLSTINHRLDFLELLIRSEKSFFAIGERLPNFPDLECVAKARP